MELEGPTLLTQVYNLKKPASNGSVKASWDHTTPSVFIETLKTASEVTSTVSLPPAASSRQNPIATTL
jgi:hypothetical protein